MTRLRATKIGLIASVILLAIVNLIRRGSVR